MKKHIFKNPLIILLLCILCLSCDKEEPANPPAPEFAKVRPVNMPAFFEPGESYNIEVVYVLPSSCHTPFGLGIERKGNSAEGLRNIFVTGITRKDSEDACDEQEEANPEIDDSFYISIDQQQPYTFYFWTGLNENGEHQFEEVQIPVKSTKPE